jgi:hypothetical protein
MRLRRAALVLLAASGALFIGVTLPARQAVAAFNDPYRRARDARRATAQRLAKAEKRESAWQRVSALAPAAPVAGGEPAPRLRHDVLEAVQRAGVTSVRLSVRPARAPVAATLSLSAQGSLQAAARLSDDLTLAQGLILERVRMAPAGEGVTFELSGLRLLGAL